MVVEGWALEAFKGFLQDRVQQRLVEQITVTSQFFEVEVSKVFAQDRVQELHPQVLALRKRLLMGFLALFPE